MRLLKKLLFKVVTFVLTVMLMGGVMRYARPYLFKAAGLPAGVGETQGLEGANFSSEESDLMALVFKSALKLVSGQSTRSELASELSDNLYSGQSDEGTRDELGIELVKPANGASLPGLPAGSAKPAAGTKAPGHPAAAKASPNANGATSPATAADAPAAARGPNKAQQAMVAQLGRKAVANPELAVAPVVLLAMLVIGRFRRRRTPEDDFILPDVAMQGPAETEKYEMKFPVHTLDAEDFAMLVALIYQRQGYRVSMPAGQSGGRGGDFTLARKAERLLVQCKRLSQETRVPVERVREFHEAILSAGMTRGLFVASCAFSWDAKNFAKTRGVTVINSRTLDALIATARENPKEDLLAVSEWAPKFMSKVQLTPPLCPSCEASMVEISVSRGAAWVCSQRPECKGRRNPRKLYVTKAPAPEPEGEQAAEPAAVREGVLPRVLENA